MRNPFRRGPAVPSDVLVRARLGRGDRVLAAAAARDGTWLLGTRSALVIVPVAEPVEAPVHILPWERVESADWSSDEDRLRVTEVGEYGRAQPRHLFVIDRPGQLLQLVRERVTASVVLQRRVNVTRAKGLYVVARRSPTGQGQIRWAYEFDEGVDPADPEVRRLAESGLRAAAEELGLS